MRKWIVVLATLVVLAVVNFTIADREKLLVEGRVVLLELAPVDPRSLMQGDYMALRLKVANDAFGWSQRKLKDGQIVVALGEHGVAVFKRFADESAPAVNEIKLRYRIRDGQVKFGTNAFFFQEGTASRYEKARYGEFRVAPSGDMILTGLRGADFASL
jgi:uncharacterized membrane-anchored protein